MLPSAHRLRLSSDFSRASGRGERSRRGVVVVHVKSNGSEVSRVGFTIGRGVGGSVVRHRTARRVREVVRPLLRTMPQGFDVVVRCLPEAAMASFEELGRDVEQALKSALAKQVRQ